MKSLDTNTISAHIVLRINAMASRERYMKQNVT